MLALLAASAKFKSGKLPFVWLIRLETADEGVGGWAALLGPGLELTLVVTLADPANFARIACRLALRAARISSTGGGDGGSSRSISGSFVGRSFELIGFCDSSRFSGGSSENGEPRGEILRIG